jgi:hypothetical protein
MQNLALAGRRDEIHLRALVVEDMAREVARRGNDAELYFEFDDIARIEAELEEEKDDGRGLYRAGDSRLRSSRESMMQYERDLEDYRENNRRGDFILAVPYSLPGDFSRLVLVKIGTEGRVAEGRRTARGLFAALGIE